MDTSPRFVLISDHCQHCQATITILKFLELPLQIIDNEQAIPPALFNSIQAFIICGFLTENVWQTYWNELTTKAPATSLIVIDKQINQNFANRHIETLSLPLAKTALQRALNRSQIWQTRQPDTRIAPNHPGLINLIGKSQAVQQLRRAIAQVSQSDTSVLILGESGTGKEIIAQSIHLLSERHGKAFVPVNCGAIPSELMESELFGHEKGAFTGAITQREGRFELANGGTLFLDEIGDMPPAMQVKLLRVLQERCFERVGSNKSINADVRIIAATHQDLEASIKNNQFREDLYYRLNVFPITAVALRQRTEDIPLLLNYFIEFLGKRLNCSLQFTEAAIAALSQYTWPGNIRELMNLIERLMV